MDDLDLIQRATDEADLDAFGELVRRHQSHVRHFLRRLCAGDWHRADDLAQDAFLAAHRRLHAFDRKRAFSSWILGIAYNTFRNDRRAIRPAREWTGEDAGLAPTHAEAVAARLDLESAMRRLTSGEAAALTLCYQNGCSHDEAARVLGVPLGTLKSWVQRGKDRLRVLLSENTSS